MTKKKNKGGRSEIVFTEEQTEKVKELSAYLTCEQIADYFGISHVTFQEVRRRQEEVSFAYKKGKVCKVYDYAKKLENKAMGIDENGDTTAIIFYLKTQGRWSTENKSDNNIKVPLGNKSAMEIVNSTLTALEEGEINVPQAQQLTSLALAKMNIETRTQEDKAVSEQMSIEEAKAFAKELDQTLQKLDLLEKKIKK